MAISSLARGLRGMVLLLVLSLLPACSNDGGGTVAPPPGGLELNSGVIDGNNGVYAHTFNTSGTFPYHCQIHGSSMRDTIRVDASSSNMNVAISIVNKAFVPRGSTVKPGGRVTWTNDDGTDHTVTSD